MTMRTKKINITVSQTLSCDTSIKVPEDFDIFDEEALKDIVREQIYLPFEAINEHSQDLWEIDDFCVMI